MDRRKVNCEYVDCLAWLKIGISLRLLSKRLEFLVALLRVLV